VAYSTVAADLADVWYAASLTPNPTLDPQADPAHLAEYAKTGRDLAASLRSAPSKVIRCANCGTRQARPGHKGRSMALLHGRNLLALQESRGGQGGGVRMERHLLVHLPLAKAHGFDSLRLQCDCGCLHELGFGWLRRAPAAEPSMPIAQFALYSPDTPAGEVEFPPRSPNDVEIVAFARTAGPLDSPHLQVALTPLPYAFYYRDRFGFDPPHDEHLLRLIGEGNPHLEVFGIRDKIIPQWRQLQLDPEARARAGFGQPLSDEELYELAEAMKHDDPDLIDAFLDLLRHLDPDAFTTLQRLLTEDQQ
jgi:hypothetical protein